MVQSSISGGLLQAYLNLHINEIKHVFAVVNLGNFKESGPYPWLVPVYADYGVFVNNSVSNSGILAIMMLTSGHETRPVPRTDTISPGLIPDGCKASLLVSAELYLMNLVGPALESKWSGKFSSFVFKGTGITNTAQFNLFDVSVGGISYTPKVAPNHFVISLEHGILNVSVQSNIDISPGITTYASQSTHYQIQLDKGKQVFNFQQVDDSVVDTHTEVDDWVTWSEVAGGIVAGIAAVFTGGASEAAYGVAMGVILGAITAIPQYLELRGNQVSDQTVGSAGFAVGISSVQWNGETSFKVKESQLGNCLILGADTN